MTSQVMQGDALEVLPTLADSSVDLIATDPPYFKVKGEWWDRQWDNPAAFLDWMGRLCEQWERVLKPNGSLYVFASPRMAARVECKIGETFNVLQQITWNKAGANYAPGDLRATAYKAIAHDALRMYFQHSERVIFAEHYGADNIAKGEAGYVAKCDDLRGFVFEPLRAYLDGERQRAGMSLAECEIRLGWTAASVRHCFVGGLNFWRFPTSAKYAMLQDTFAGYFCRDYEDLRRDYEDLRRPFQVSADVPYTDVWDFPTVKAYPGKHPAEKPLAMMEHIIRASSRPGAVVLDCFAGSGTTGVAASRLGRDFIGIELDAGWCERARERIGTTQPALLEAL